MVQDRDRPTRRSSLKFPMSVETQSQSRNDPNNLKISSSLKRDKDLSEQRDALRYMIQDRDEQISSLQNITKIQNEHILKLDARLEVFNRREKQCETRHEMQIAGMSNDQDIIRSQLKVLQDDLQRIKSDPARHALIQLPGATIRNKGRRNSIPTGFFGGHQNMEKNEVIDDTSSTREAKMLQGQLYDVTVTTKATDNGNEEALRSRSEESSQ